MGSICAYNWLTIIGSIMAGIVITTEPAQEPITLQEVKEHLRVEDGIDERILRPLIQTARMFAEEHLGRKLVTTVLTQTYDVANDFDEPLWEGMRVGADIQYYKNYLTLSHGPVVSVAHIKTYDDSDTATTFASTKYYLDNSREPARILLRKGQTWESNLRVANGIEVQYTVGYSSIYAIPEPIRMGMLHHVAHLYEHRGDMYEASNPYPPMLKTLYAPYVIHKGLGSNSLMAIG